MNSFRFTVLLGLCLLLNMTNAFNVRSVESVSESIAQVKQGTIQGKMMQATNGRNFHAFFGIPFGKVLERFKEADPAGPWTGTLQATENAPACLQYDAWFLKKVLGIEDCLTLNVYTPKLPENGKSSERLPVLLYIHGGGFLVGDGTSSNFGPERFLNNDIVLVVIQYRLGPFGFLSTHDEASQGNYGLLDQNLAIRWTKDNIENFGGDPDKITIFGESAGGASVIYQVLSPLSEGLFHSAIAQSGSVLCPWALQENPLDSSARIAAQLNCPTDDTKNLVECLRKAEALDVLMAFNSSGMYADIPSATVPVVENSNGGRFLTESPWKLFKEGRFNKVPMIIGVTENEGAFLAVLDPSSLSSAATDTEEEFRQNKLPHLISFTTGVKNDSNFRLDVEEKYFKEMDFNNKTDVFTRLIEFVSDWWFKGCSDATIRYIADQNVPVYMYVFDYATQQHSLSNFTGKPDVVHGQDLFYQFTMSVPPFNYKGPFTDEEIQLSANVIDSWTNFANTSEPKPNNIQWKPTTAEEIAYLRLNANPKMETGFREDKLKFWKSKYENTS